MKKKQKEFFKRLLELPEVKENNCAKIVNQLRSFIEQFDKQKQDADEELCRKIIVRVSKLQNIISDGDIKKSLRIIQSKCDKQINHQLHEFLNWDPSGGNDWPFYGDYDYFG